MVGHEAKGVNPIAKTEGTFLKQEVETAVVSVGQKNILPSVAPEDNMIESTRKVNAWFACHGEGTYLACLNLSTWKPDPIMCDPIMCAIMCVTLLCVDSVLSMHWAEYRSNSNKAKLHLGFDLNHGIPRKLFLTDGKGAERPFVSRIIDPGQTAVLDRGYQAHLLFDQWQSDGCHFVCRIKGITIKEVQEEYPLPENSYIFRDVKVLLGTPGVNQTQQPVRLVGYTVDDKTYWIATDRFDLTAEQVAFVYKLRWDIEKFFAWWKRHLNVYHLFARSKNGLMVQILSGLITYLLLAIYCHEKHGEPVSISRMRQLRNQIRNEATQQARGYGISQKRSQRQRRRLKKSYASS